MRRLEAGHKCGRRERDAFAQREDVGAAKSFAEDLDGAPVGCWSSAAMRNNEVLPAPFGPSTTPWVALADSPSSTSSRMRTPSSVERHLGERSREGVMRGAGDGRVASPSVSPSSSRRPRGSARSIHGLDRAHAVTRQAEGAQIAKSWTTIERAFTARGTDTDERCSAERHSVAMAESNPCDVRGARVDRSAAPPAGGRGFLPPRAKPSVRAHDEDLLRGPGTPELFAWPA